MLHQPRAEVTIVSWSEPPSLSLIDNLESIGNDYHHKVAFALVLQSLDHDGQRTESIVALEASARDGCWLG